ncbi:hypothetical protein G6O67_004478 [Ophiocordyceps sinensis]|uniref:Uncharacterized protein n=1 Tax=Ophiocordyceps sinensis TaxID=72228 RepID=A0A8H4PPH6_9HYPO|nr:hypothetical protein G6O67_004478 [Ophiocordyceps sinensis]
MSTTPAKGIGHVALEGNAKLTSKPAMSTVRADNVPRAELLNTAVYMGLLAGQKLPFFRSAGLTFGFGPCSPSSPVLASATATGYSASLVLISRETGAVLHWILILLLEDRFCSM